MPLDCVDAFIKRGKSEMKRFETEMNRFKKKPPVETRGGQNQLLS